jgi:acyl-CoA synthetase (AMP-forming)/AMP-acid ligase II
VAAVVQLYDDGTPIEELDRHCRTQLSGYKVPRTYAFVAEMRRSPAGKADYRWAKEVAKEVAKEAAKQADEEAAKEADEEAAQA